jgi:hypothetical protein
MGTEQMYCVAAEDRDTKVRKAITGPCDYQTAMIKKVAYNSSTMYKKMFRYFHVAKHPYKPHTNS